MTLLRSSFTTTDSAAALPALEPFYPRIRLSSRGAFQLDLSVVDAGLIGTVRFRLTSPSSAATADGSSSLTIAHITGARMGVVGQKGEVDTRKPVLFPDRPIHASWDDVQVGTINLDLTAVHRFARQLSGSDSFRLAFTGTGPVSPALSRFWIATVGTLNRELLRDDEAMTSPLVRRAAFEQLALAVLAVFPNTLMERRGPPDTVAAVPAAVRRATAYIDENLSAEITVADIAAAAGMSARGLAAAFRRELDTTPMALLRSGRLAAAHHDLLSVGPEGSTVTAIAHRWGFGNPGRFAVAYREQFGTS